MPLSRQQFEHLNAMGIELWQRKSSTVTEHQQASQTNSKNLAQLDQPALSSSRLLSDILQSIGVDKADIQFHQSHIDLGLINWQFNTDSASSCQFQHQCLTTPELKDIAATPTLKKQLWQLFTAQHLNSKGK
ncbi:DNA polymerase III subunit psi [Endozoicomonas sp. G2_1]|uniref:DNA polymerase III subunit psi n=1 Tax=Endozoicomonas sp. G2_1 TaxID=2821091 RepID=UPI001ADC1B88|nr:DNA polymerase III subunit psi [Endozoicomonas sp. G2_1]MBO9490102.1 DNA polymerase III subunit psi [Endozoicomonas sp. G2_1]